MTPSDSSGLLITLFIMNIHNPMHAQVGSKKSVQCLSTMSMKRHDENGILTCQRSILLSLNTHPIVLAWGCVCILVSIKNCTHSVQPVPSTFTHIFVQIQLCPLGSISMVHSFIHAALSWAVCGLAQPLISRRKLFNLFSKV